MKSFIPVFILCAVAAFGQDTNVTVQGTDASAQDTNAIAQVAPPTITTLTFTQNVPVVVTSAVTQMVINVQTQVVYSPVVSTTAVLRAFTVFIDNNQNPQGFVSRFSDGSAVVTPAGGVAAMTNRAVVNAFNGMLRDVVANGQRYSCSNGNWRVRGTNGAWRGSGSTNGWRAVGAGR